MSADSPPRPWDSSGQLHRYQTRCRFPYGGGEDSQIRAEPAISSVSDVAVSGQQTAACPNVCECSWRD